MGGKMNFAAHYIFCHLNTRENSQFRLILHRKLRENQEQKL
jgi:hypothetical protein